MVIVSVSDVSRAESPCKQKAAHKSHRDLHQKPSLDAQATSFLAPLSPRAEEDAQKDEEVGDEEVVRLAPMIGEVKEEPCVAECAAEEAVEKSGQLALVVEVFDVDLAEVCEDLRRSVSDCTQV